MRGTDEHAIVRCDGVRAWRAILERDPTLTAAGAWPEQALRNLGHLLGIERAQRVQLRQLGLPPDLDDALQRCLRRREECAREQAALDLLIVELAERLIILGVRRVMTADLLALHPQRLSRLLTRANGLSVNSREVPAADRAAAE